jgi:hypothetical protein
MTPQDINQLIQSLPSWQQLNPQELFAQLDSKTILYQDKKTYRLDDIAKLIGDANMNTFLDVVRAAGYDWMITQAATGFYPYEDPINSRLRLLNHPLSLQIANHTNRMISILEQNNLVTTPEEVAQVQASMKLALYVEAQIDRKQDQLNTYKEAMNLWDGNPDTEPRF